jgi:hypothetical protein
MERQKFYAGPEHWHLADIEGVSPNVRFWG